jgi:AcrR family transcriptional regulator
MPPDSSATKARLLDAAFEEFAQHGLAGARVDRIAERAGANKRLLYVYFGNKAELFDLVVGRAISQMAVDVPFDAGDLPGYAGALFDYLVAHPAILRLSGWRQLERPTVTEAESVAYREKVDAIGPGAGDFIALVTGAATGWLTASPALHELDGGNPFSPARLARYRAALVAAVARLPREPAAQAR